MTRAPLILFSVGWEGPARVQPVTLDQLRAFVTIVEEGSFSVAARKLRRVQSAISKSMANREDQLGIALLDRSTKKAAKLSCGGATRLAAARRVLLDHCWTMAESLRID